MKHRPTPWHVHGEPWKPQPGASDVVSIAWSEHGELVADSVYAENAEFIVRACNLHDDLVTAVRDYWKELIAKSDHQATESIEALLARAEGR